MTNPVSAPETTAVEPQQATGGWEIVMRCFVIVVGIFLGLIAALITAASIGWLSLDLC